MAKAPENNVFKLPPVNPYVDPALAEKDYLLNRPAEGITKYVGVATKLLDIVGDRVAAEDYTDNAVELGKVAMAIGMANVHLRMAQDCVNKLMDENPAARQWIGENFKVEDGHA